MMRKENITTIIIVGVLFFICFLIVIIFGGRKSNNISPNNNNADDNIIVSNFDSMQLDNDYTSYFGVIQLVNNYITFISSKDKIGVYNLLYEEYIDNNNITYNNIFNYVGNYSGVCSLKADDIYKVKLESNYLYYVKGSVVEDDYDGEKLLNSDFKVLVLSDNDNYAIYPVADNNYKEIINNIKSISIDGNSSNAIEETKSISNNDVCKMYFSDFMRKLLYDTDNAYNLLDNNMLDKYTSLNSFRNYISINKSRFTAKSKVCNYNIADGKRVYIATDTNNNSFTFTEESVMKYKVNFSLNNND